MENSPTVIGPSGIIKQHEFVRVIIQCLYSLGFRRSASCLESESGIPYKSADIEMLKSQIFDGDWDGCVNTINSIKDMTDEVRSSVLFLVFKQCFFEHLDHGDDHAALGVLRKNVSVLTVGKENVCSLAYSMLSRKDTKSGSADNSLTCELRKKLWFELEKMIPPPNIVPERRLEHLVETALINQMDFCMYHNSSHEISLYKDHCCGRDQIPTETTQILTIHRNEVWFLQFSNNGEYLATASCDSTAIIWKVLDDGRVAQEHVLQGHQNSVSFVAWSPDDMKLLTIGNSEVAKLWDVETGACNHTFGGQDFVISSCAWFPDSKQLVCGCSDPEKGIRMFDCDGNELKAWKGPRIPRVMDLSVTRDGEYLISVFSTQEIHILNLGTNVERVISEKHQITSLAVSGDNKFFIVNLNSQEIHMWDIAGKLDKPLKYTGHEQRKYVLRSCFGGFNSSFIASGSENCKVYIWNRKVSKPIEELSGHTMTVNCVSWNPRKPQMLASSSDDHTVRIWGPSRSMNM